MVNYSEARSEEKKTARERRDGLRSVSHFTFEGTRRSVLLSVSLLMERSKRMGRSRAKNKKQQRPFSLSFFAPVQLVSEAARQHKRRTIVKYHCLCFN